MCQICINGVITRTSMQSLSRLKSIRLQDKTYNTEIQRIISNNNCSVGSPSFICNGQSAQKIFNTITVSICRAISLFSLLSTWLSVLNRYYTGLLSGIKEFTFHHHLHRLNLLLWARLHSSSSSYLCYVVQLFSYLLQRTEEQVWNSCVKHDITSSFCTVLWLRWVLNVF